MLQRLNVVFYPPDGCLTEARIDEMLLEFCVNCPDPGSAMDAVIDAPRGVTPEQLLDEVLAMPPRSPASYSADQLSLDHPLRHWRVQLRAV